MKENIPLASGIDSLDISMDTIRQPDSPFCEYLSDMKKIAKETKQDVAIKFPFTQQIALLKPYGRNGYEWIIETNEFTMTIGNWDKPISRPSITASIRSLALWNIGAEQIIQHISSIIKKSGAEILSIKPSRIDLCLDITIPASLWNVGLIPLKVTKSSYSAPHFFNNTLTGISIGKGQTVARLYDKPLEIKQKSKKFWMYDIWEIDQNIPDDTKIIRVEAQFRRETIKQLGLEFIDDVFPHIDKLWAYFSQIWLKFEDNAGQHHTMRKTIDWWTVVQNSFLGIQKPTPLILRKALNTSKKQLYAQTSGTLTSILALDHETKEKPLGESATLSDLQHQFEDCFQRFGKSDFELEIELFNKRAKYHRERKKMKDIDQARRKLGHPSNIDMRTSREEENND